MLLSIVFLGGANFSCEMKILSLCQKAGLYPNRLMHLLAARFSYSGPQTLLSFLFSLKIQHASGSRAQLPRLDTAPWIHVYRERFK